MKGRNELDFDGVFARATLAFFLFVGVGWTTSSAFGETRKKIPSAPVRVEKIVEQSVRPFVSLIGTAEPYKKSTVASETAGMVVEFAVRLGQKVRKGDALAEVEKRPLILDRKEAEAALAEAQENHKNAMSDLQRNEELVQKKAISDRQYDDARYRANALNQKIAALKARIEGIEYDLAKCRIKAPFAGFVVAEHTQVGQWLEKGGEVVTIVHMDSILITVPVPDRYVRYIKPGQVVDLSFEFTTGGESKQGRVRDVIPLGNEKARTFPVQLEVDNPDFSILAGMSASVRFPVGNPTTVLLVNKDAVVTNGDQHHIFIVNDDKAHLIPVKKGGAHGSQVAIQGDVAAGQRVVVEGNERLRPEQPVEILANSEK
jgi:RND family efflux transporter MFP subunit